MKLFNAIAATAAVIGGSFLIPVPAEARNGWIYIGTGSRTQTSHYVKKLGYQGPFVKFQWQTNGNSSWNITHLGDCKAWHYREIKESGWDDALPQTMGDNALEKMCR